MKTIELSKYKGKRAVTLPQSSRHGTGRSDPFSIAFVYPREGDPVVVKGIHGEVLKYVKAHFPVSLVRFTFWQNGVSRGLWRFFGVRIYVTHSSQITKVDKDRRGFTVTVFNSDNRTNFHFRRMPKKWLSIFDTAGRRIWDC